jgi:hypothetical protein
VDSDKRLIDYDPNYKDQEEQVAISESGVVPIKTMNIVDYKLMERNKRMGLRKPVKNAKHI